MQRNKQIDIKRALALSNTFHFLCSCARACIFPFLTLYFRQLGLTPTMVGIIMGAKHFISLVWSPVASLLSKHYNRRRVVIIGSLICSAGAASIVPFFPSVSIRALTSSCNTSDLSGSPTEDMGGHGLETVNTVFVPPSANVSLPQAPNDTDPMSFVKTKASPPSMVNQEQLDNAASPPKLSLNNTSAVVSTGFSYFNSNESFIGLNTSVVSPSVRGVRSVESNSEDERQQREAEEYAASEFLGSLKVMDVQHQLFFLCLIIVVIWEVVSAPLDWTADDGLYEYLDFVDATDRYGSSWMWGLLGATCGIGGISLLVSHLSCVVGGDIPRSAMHFFCYGGMMVLVLPLASYMPLFLNKKRDKANGLLKAMQLVRVHPRALLCSATTLLMGIAISAVENFLLWQMQDRGSNELHFGAALALALLSHAAFPLLADRVSKLISPGRVLIVSTISLALQCLYYSFIWDPWSVLPVQLLSCLSRGAFWWAVQSHCEDVATPGAERSVKRVYQGLSLNLGLGLGSFSGGLAVQRFGATWLFRGAAVVLVLWCLCLPLLQWKAPRQRRINYSRLLAAEASDSDSEPERDWLDKAFEEDKSNNNRGRRVNH